MIFFCSIYWPNSLITIAGGNDAEPGYLSDVLKLDKAGIISKNLFGGTLKNKIEIM